MRAVSGPSDPCTAFASMLRTGPPSTEAAAARAVDTAPGLIDGRRRKVRKAARRLAPDSPPPMWHDLRIRCKRLRYAIVGGGMAGTRC